MADEIINGAPPEPPLHAYCRCILVPILIGDSGAASSGPSYEKWFDGRSEAEQLDIIGPSRFVLYKAGKKVTEFAKGKKIITLEDLGASRITRKELFEQQAGSAPIISDQVMGYLNDLDYGIKGFDDLRDSAKELYLEKIDKDNLEQMVDTLGGSIQDGSVVRHENLFKILQNIDDFENDPRFKTQFETGSSGGLYNPERREEIEAKLLLKSNDVDLYKESLSVKERPVYGELLKKWDSIIDTAASGYGDLHLVLSDSARERTSFTIGDSLTALSPSFKKQVWAGLQTNNEGVIDTMLNTLNDFVRNSSGNRETYIEAQVWGGIDISRGDVSQVVFKKQIYDYNMALSSRDKFKRLLDIFENNKVKIVIVDD